MIRWLLTDIWVKDKKEGRLCRVFRLRCRSETMKGEKGVRIGSEEAHTAMHSLLAMLKGISLVRFPSRRTSCRNGVGLWSLPSSVFGCEQSSRNMFWWTKCCIRRCRTWRLLISYLPIAFCLEGRFEQGISTALHIQILGLLVELFPKGCRFSSLVSLLCNVHP